MTNDQFTLVMAELRSFREETGTKLDDLTDRVTSLESTRSFDAGVREGRDTEKASHDAAAASKTDSRRFVLTVAGTAAGVGGLIASVAYYTFTVVHALR